MSTSIVDYERHIERGKEKELLRGYLKPEDFSSNSANFVAEQLGLSLLRLVTTFKIWIAFIALEYVFFRNGIFSAEWFRNRYVNKGEASPKQDLKMGEHKKVEVESENSFQNTLVYNGKIKNQVNVDYREF